MVDIYIGTEVLHKVYTTGNFAGGYPTQISSMWLLGKAINMEKFNAPDKPGLAQGMWIYCYRPILDLGGAWEIQT